MIAAVRVLRRTLGDAWDALVLLVVLNLAWVALAFSVVLLPPATAALFDVTHELARGRTPDLMDFARAIRRHFWRAWGWALLNLLVWGIVIVNLLFYGQFADLWAMALQAVFVLVGIFWFVSQLYVWPYILEQDAPSLPRALRNAALTVLAAPVFSLVLVLLIGAVLLVSYLLLLPLVALATGFFCLLANHAVIDRLQAFGKLPAPDA